MGTHGATNQRTPIRLSQWRRQLDMGLLELLVDFLAPLFGDASSHADEVVLDAERDHALCGCCVFLVF
jgi:hypothetical protein